MPSALARLTPEAAARWAAGLRARRASDRRFVTAVDPRDDLLNHARENASGSRWPDFQAYAVYFGGGLANVDTIVSALRDGGVVLADAPSVLEFASGHGRLTRHLVSRVERSRLVVSDIDHPAVDFVTSTFGVSGFYSAADPDDLVRGERYDVIVVVSLFSHLPEATWGRWLSKLLSLLTPSGTLVFTTHPLGRPGEELLAEDRDGFARGFLYKLHNETRGRLDVEHYGTSCQSFDYVSSALARAGAELLHHRPRALGIQDAYVVRCASRP